MHDHRMDSLSSHDLERIAPTRSAASLGRRTGRLLLASLPWVLLTAAVGYSLALQAAITDGVFFSGDGGLKALMTRQFASSEPRFDLVLPAEPWVRTLWDAGIYPFQPPFAYTIDGHTYTQYSYPFPLVSAPLYSLFGHRGLYVIPLLSTWALWLVFLRACRALELGPIATCAAFGSLAFASPLTFYSATFWEHTLAVSLAFFGLSRLLRYASSSGAGMTLGGAALGLSTWFREELLCLVCALVLLLGLGALFRRPGVFGVPKISRFFTGMLLLVLGSFTLNTLIYGHPLGVHSFPVLHHGFSLAGRIVNAWTLFLKLGSYLLDTLPMVGFLVMTLVLLLAPERFRGRTHELFLLKICVLFIGSVPLVLPDVKLDGDGGKQWGPRFLLLLVPLVSLATAMAMKRLWTVRQHGVRYPLALVFLGLIGLGGYRNVYEGTEYLTDDYQLRVLPVLEFLKKHPGPNIAVRYQHIAQELRFSLPQKNFFLTNDPTAFRTLASGLLEQDVNHFLYLRYYNESQPDPISFEAGGLPHAIDFTEAGQYGIYTVYDASVE